MGIINFVSFGYIGILSTTQPHSCQPRFSPQCLLTLSRTVSTYKCLWHLPIALLCLIRWWKLPQACDQTFRTGKDDSRDVIPSLRGGGKKKKEKKKKNRMEKKKVSKIWDNLIFSWRSQNHRDLCEYFSSKIFSRGKFLQQFTLKYQSVIFSVDSSEKSYIVPKLFHCFWKIFFPNAIFFSC